MPENAVPRLQVLLAHYGVASRRRAAELIESGRVEVNGQVVTEPGWRPAEGEKIASIKIDGAPVALREQRFRAIMLNKPAGLICSSSEGQGPTIYECLGGIWERLVPAGRLDKESEGLLILSNDGDLINRLTHPSFGHARKYMVTVRGDFARREYDALRRMRELEDGTPIRPVGIEYVDSPPNRFPPRHRIIFRLAEGKNRQIRRMCAIAGLHVDRLVRLEIGHLRLPGDLRPGEWRDLSDREICDALMMPRAGRGGNGDARRR